MFLKVEWIYSFVCVWISQLRCGKESACQCRRCKRHGFHLWIRKIPWRRKWHPTSVFLPGKSHGQRSLVGCSPWGHRVIHMHTENWRPPILLYLTKRGNNRKWCSSLTIVIFKIVTICKCSYIRKTSHLKITKLWRIILLKFLPHVNLSEPYTYRYQIWNLKLMW